MKVNQWTKGLAAMGVISLASAVQAEEAKHQLMTAVSSTTLSGYVDTSAIWKFGTGNGALPGRAAQDGPAKMDGFNLNAVNLTIEKPLDEAAWSAGYKAELIFGPDNGVYTQAIAEHVKQAYVTLNAPVGNGLNFKMGAFDTIIGYETFNNYQNPNYSRSYGWNLEPTQHTGLLASYQLTDWLGLSGGVANSWTPNNIGMPMGEMRSETQKTYLASATLTAPESSGFLSGSALYLGIVDGRAMGNGSTDTTSYYAGVSIPTPLEGVSFGASFDYVENGPNNALVVATSTTDNWAWAAAGYVSWQATEKLKLNGRFDYTKGTDGLFGVDAGTPGANEHVELLAATATLDYALWENVITRLEFRWDHSVNGDKIYGGNATSDMDEDATTLALNVIYRF